MKSSRFGPAGPADPDRPASAGPASAEPDPAEAPALPRWRRRLRGRGLPTALGTLVVALALTGPLFVPRAGGEAVGPWLPMGRILEPGHGHHRHRRPPISPDRDRPTSEPGTRFGGARVPWQGTRFNIPAERSPEPRVPNRQRRTRQHPGPRGLFTSWHHLQCKVLHRHC